MKTGYIILIVVVGVILSVILAVTLTKKSGTQTSPFNINIGGGAGGGTSDGKGGGSNIAPDSGGGMNAGSWIAAISGALATLSPAVLGIIDKFGKPKKTD